MLERLNALTVAHKEMKNHVRVGNICIDATAGRGRDAVFLADLVGPEGKVIAFDIQQDALDSTKELLTEEGLMDRVTLILDNHSKMEQYAEKETVDCITFNLGWLPGGDHSVFTTETSSIAAIVAGLRLLKVGGLMSICIYYGRDCGYDERDALKEYLPTLDHKSYSVVIAEFVNRPNDPPIPVFIRKEKESESAD